MNKPKRKLLSTELKIKKERKKLKQEIFKMDDICSNYNTNQYLSNISLTSTKNETKQKTTLYKIPYLDWNLCFDIEQYLNNPVTVKKIETMEMFLKDNKKLITQNDFLNSFKIDINLLYNSEVFLKNWPDFKKELKNKPEYSLNCLELAVNKFRIDELQKVNKIFDDQTMNAFIRVRILNYDPIVSLKNIKINYYGKLITVRGYIIRTNKSYHMPSILVIVCKKCKMTYSIKQKFGTYLLKKKCDLCGNTKLKPDLTSPNVKTVPLQVVRIQEYFGENDDQGKMPRVMNIELYEDLVNTCIPGDDVTITGIVKMHGIDNGKIKVNAVSTLYIEAVSVNKTKIKNNEILRVELNTKDYKIIKDIYMNLDILTLLVHSLCPEIYGHEMIKMALLLSLFGGNSKNTNLRDNIHILLLGDPGLGKSQMLKTCAQIAHKGVYVSGNSSTSSGLTVTLVKEAGQNDFGLEPGALVLADKGSCCIDEFDKMPNQHQALLEAMEQQKISIAKSGVTWSLPSRTSILAAANPIGGHYDKTKIFCKNMNISQPLLSRFDLIFLLLDEADKELDNFLSRHVMLMHTGNEKTKKQDFINYTIQSNNQLNSLRNRLLTISKHSIQTVSLSLLRTYISYARQHVKPKLSRASATILKKFYLSLCKIINTSENLFSCTRKLEALIRLTEARAKLDLREETTEQDAMDVIELMQHSMFHLNDEKTNHVFLQNNKVYKNTTKILLKILTKDVIEKNNNLYSINELKILGIKEGLAESDILIAIDKLNDKGFLIKKSNNLYSFFSL